MTGHPMTAAQLPATAAQLPADTDTGTAMTDTQLSPASAKAAPAVPEVLVCLHASRSLARTVRGIREVLPHAHVLLLETVPGLAAAALSRDDERVHVLSSSSVLDGVAWGLDKGFERVVEMSDDDRYSPADLPVLLARAETYGVGVVIGSQPAASLRERFADRLASLTRSLPVRDTASGLRVFTDDALRSVDLTDADDRSEIVRRIHQQHWLVVEEPVTVAG